MTPLEQLYRLEIAFHEKVRTLCAGRLTEVGSVHTSYALQHGYEGRLRGVKGPSGQDVDRLTAKLSCVGDLRDVFAARDSVKQLIGLPFSES